MNGKFGPSAVEQQVGLICYSPLAQGLLTGRYATADAVPDGLSRTRLYANSRSMAEHSDPGCEAEVFTALAAIRRIADDLGQPMATVALAWVKAQAGVTSFLVGARKPEELAWNLPVLDLTLSADLLAELSRITDPVKAKLGNNPDMWMSTSRMR